MYRLYWDRGSASMAPHAILVDTGSNFELAHIDASKKENRSPAYLAVNPHARVPTLIDGDKAMYESAAICLYLCEQHPQAGLYAAGGIAAAPLVSAMAYVSHQHGAGRPHALVARGELCRW